ncbi:MAG: hypothetical protein JXA42_03640 [Anaerolineales bacterium]|nr:hypothetical protein [Anaerolineales bacterium]
MNGKSNRNEGESNSETSPARIDLNALPSLTTFLFALITGVILVAVVVGLCQNFSALGLIVVAGIVVLPLYDFLRCPERDLHSLGLSDSSAESFSPSLAQEVEEAAKDLGLHRFPRLIVAPHSVAPFTLGTWRRNYLVVGRPQIDKLERLPFKKRRALWLHEMAHFVSGDNWKVGLARSLLRVSIVFMGWSALFILGTVLLAYNYGQEIFEPGFLDSLGMDPTMHSLLALFWPDPALMAPMLEKAKATNLGLISLYVLNSHLPFVFSGFVLLIYVWRKLHQVRELYADTRVATRMGNVQDTGQAMMSVADEMIQFSASPSKRIGDWFAVLSRSFNDILPFQLKWKTRIQCLEDPIKIFGSWKWIGCTAGLTVLLLDLILIGPFTLSYVGSSPAHLTTVAGFFILALWLLPMICQGFSIRKISGQVIGSTLLVVGMRAGWLLINIVLVFALLVFTPASVEMYLNTFVLLGAKILTIPSELPLQGDPVNLAAQAIGGACSFTVLALLSILGGLFVTTVLLRRLLTWYGFLTTGRRLIHVSYCVILVVALILGFAVLPPLTAMIHGDWESFLKPASLMISGLALLFALVWGLWFIHTERRFAGLCPNCNEKANGCFELGIKCKNCGKILYPWLLASY